MNHAQMEILKTELSTDPLTRGYSGMTDSEIVASFKVVDRSRHITSLSGSQVINAIVISEWNSLTETHKQEVWDIVHLGTINPWGIEATMMISVFGAESDTITALAAIRKEDINRGTEIGLPIVYEGNVQEART